MASERKRRTDKYLDKEYMQRPSWVNARTAYRQVCKGKADGNKYALWVRKHMQNYLYLTGCFIHLHCGKVLFVGLLLLSLCCVGLKSVKFETNVEKLWIEEGGRLEKELQYTKDAIAAESETTNQIVIQTPKSGNNILTPASFKQHQDALVKASEISITMFDVEWRLRDMCYLAKFPLTENTFLDTMLEYILPCVIITPLDCFWEGSLALGPYGGFKLSGFVQLRWTNLSPLEMLLRMKKPQQSRSADIDIMLEVLQKANITSGYMEKPCINPSDPDCPATAPNKLSQLPPDIGAELTGGCHGFSRKYMHWHEDLILGGVRKNQTGHIIRAEALQSIFLLMGESQMYEYWKDDSKTSNIDWTQEKAKMILEAWHREFTESMNCFSNSSMPDNMYAFSMTSLMDIMKEFSEISIPRVAISYVLMLFYACVSLFRWNDTVRSQSGVGIAGVLLVALSVAAGLGICSVIGITFNASTTQIIPFLALGLGVNDIFLITHTYMENSNKENIPIQEQTAECLKRAGTTILLTSLNNMLAFFSAVIIPIPALRAFSVQAAMLTLFNLVSVLLIYPAICSLDLIRKKHNRMDVFCCLESYGERNAVIELQPRINDQYLEHEFTSPPPYNPPPSYYPSLSSEHLAQGMIAQSAAHSVPVHTILAPADGQFMRFGSPLPGLPYPMSVFESASNSRQCLTDGDIVTCKERFTIIQKECISMSLTSLATVHYAPFLQRTPVKVFTCVFFIVILIIGIWGTTQVKDGLDLTDVVPKDTSEHGFLEMQSKYFGYYNVYLVTKELDYPNNQRLLRQFHRTFGNVDNIVKEKDGSLPTFWLDEFRTWLVGLQEAFDADYANGTFNKDGWNNNASNDAILAYILLCQTGNLDNPVDKTQVMNVRLVSAEGIIYPLAFYNYLTAWISNDALAYSYSMVEIRPQTTTWAFDPLQRYALQVPKAKNIFYAQIPFYLTKLSDNKEILNIVHQIRSICDDFASRGLPNYPSGIPFTFWEQYIKLRFYLMLALVCILGVTFIVLSVVLMNIWLAGIVVVMVTMILIELFGLMGILGLKLSAIPAVILIISVGISVEFTVHGFVAFITALGSRNSRMSVALEHTFAPVIHGAVSTFLGIIMLAGAELDFVVRYFFLVLTGLVVIGLLNGLVLLPVVLSVIGPAAEVRLKDNAERLPIPSPHASPRLNKHNLSVQATRSSRKVKYPQRIPSDLSLTTISEEPSQYSSTEIVIQPEIMVETSAPQPIDVQPTKQQSRQKITDDRGNRRRRKNILPTEPTVYTPATHHVTRVKATATVKVEVHTPLPGAVPDLQDYKWWRRKDDTASSDSDSSFSSV